jgi:hypothetical protein
MVDTTAASHLATCEYPSAGEHRDTPGQNTINAA